jgi:hypothetical protein
MLQALVHCAAAELRIAPLGLDNSWELRQRHETVRYLLRAPHEHANRRTTPTWAYWSLLYAYVALLHPPEHTRTLLRNFRRAIPNAAEAGEEAAELVRRHGFATRAQAVASLNAVRDALVLRPLVVIVGAAEGEQ